MMDLGTGLELFVVYLFVLGAVYATRRSNARWQKGLLLGVTVPESALALPQVQDVIRRYRRETNALFLGCILIYLPLFWVHRMWIWLTLWIGVLYVGMLAPSLAGIRAYRALKQLKKEQGWAVTPPLRVVDTRASEQSLPKPIGLWTLVLPLLISLAPAVVPGQASGLRVTCLIDASVLVLLWVCGRWTFRRREDMVTGDPERNQTLLRVRRCYWDRFWRLNLWGCAGLNLCMGLFRSGAAATAGGLLFTVILAGGTIWMELRVRRVQEKLTLGADIIADEDDAWLLGSFYYNPADTRVMVSKRLGLGSTMNLATEAGKWVTAVTLVVMIGCLFIGPVLGIVDGIPTRLEIRGQTLTALHGNTEKYTVELDAVTRVELRETLPKADRLMGTGLEHYLHGDFAVEGEGVANFCLDPTRPPFLRVEAAGQTYWLTAENSALTREFAQWISEREIS